MLRGGTLKSVFRKIHAQTKFTRNCYSFWPIKKLIKDSIPFLYVIIGHIMINSKNIIWAVSLDFHDPGDLRNKQVMTCTSILNYSQYPKFNSSINQQVIWELKIFFPLIWNSLVGTKMSQTNKSQSRRRHKIS